MGAAQRWLVVGGDDRLPLLGEQVDLEQVDDFDFAFQRLALEEYDGLIVCGNVAQLGQRWVHLETEQRFLEEIVEHLPNMVFVKEAANLRFVRFNAAGEALLGIPRTEMVGKNDFDFFPPTEAEFFTRMDREVLESGQPKDIPEETIQTRHGPRVLHTKKIPIFSKSGEAQYLLGMSEDITELKRSQAELRELSARLHSAEERERQNIARELHDELGQLLTALKLDLAWLENRLPEDLLAKSESMARLVDETMATVRRLVTTLRPQILDDLGLPAAIEWLAQEARTRGVAVNTELLMEGSLTEMAATQLFRICQEALTNVVRHAQARQVTIQLVVEDDLLRLCVCDDGVGLQGNSQSEGLGLVGIRERASLLAGRAFFREGREGGTQISVEVPWQRCSFSVEGS